MRCHFTKRNKKDIRGYGFFFFSRISETTLRPLGTSESPTANVSPGCTRNHAKSQIQNHLKKSMVGEDDTSLKK